MKGYSRVILYGVVVLASVAGVAILGAGDWFNAEAEVALFEESGLASRKVAEYYNDENFWICFVAWLLGTLGLVGLFFIDLVRATGSLASEKPGRNILFFGNLQKAVRRGSEPKVALAVSIPLELAFRWLLMILLYWIGLRALEVDGVVREGLSLVDFTPVQNFSRSGEFLLVAFFNTVSFVGEFASLRLRDGIDAFFVVVNIVARFFVIFLATNAAFLRLSRILAARSPEDRASEREIAT